MIRAFLFLPWLSLASAACDARAPAANVPDVPPIVRMATAQGPAAPLPALTGRIVDRADLLDAAAEAELGARLEALEKRTTTKWWW